MAETRYRLEYHPQAVAEASGAVRTYREYSDTAAERFLAQLRHAEEQVTKDPLRWATYSSGTRRFLFPKYPYALVYLVRDETIIVIAVAHLHRRPGYWKNRIEP